MCRRNYHLCNAYQDIPPEEVIAYLKSLDEHFMNFWDFCNYPKPKENETLYVASYVDLVDVILHMDKRAAYYICFHGCKSISERKRVALIAYYIVKFKPFRVTKEAPLSRDEITHVNEDFAIYIICLTLFGVAAFEATSDEPGSKTLNKMMRESFRHRSHTRNGMILLVESLTLEGFRNSYHG